MGEVQAHGFTWEKELLLNIYKLTPSEMKDIKYTSKHDLPSSMNRLDGCDVSIKTTCNPNYICMADALRVFDSLDKKLHLIVLHYKQVETTKQVVSITEVDLTESRNLLFGEVTRTQLEELDALVKKVPQKRKPTQEEYDAMYSFRDSLKCGAIRLDIKCNSTQSRLQCSFNHFQDFLEKYPERMIEKSVNDKIKPYEFRGGTITPTLLSSRRTFKAKEKIVKDLKEELGLVFEKVKDLKTESGFDL
jgi:hypothetical protein